MYNGGMDEPAQTMLQMRAVRPTTVAIAEMAVKILLVMVEGTYMSMYIVQKMVTLA